MFQAKSLHELFFLNAQKHIMNTNFNTKQISTRIFLFDHNKSHLFPPSFLLISKYSDLSLMHALFYARFSLMCIFFTVPARDIRKPMITLIHICSTLKKKTSHLCALQKFSRSLPFLFCF